MSTHSSEFLASKSWSNRVLAPRALAVTNLWLCHQPVQPPGPWALKGWGCPLEGFFMCTQTHTWVKKDPDDLSVTARLWVRPQCFNSLTL